MQPAAFPRYALQVHFDFFRVKCPDKCVCSQVCLVFTPGCSSRKEYTVLWEVSSSEMHHSIIRHTNTDSLKRLQRLKSNVCVCLTLGILVHISLKWRRLTTTDNTNNFHPFIGSYSQAHIHLFMTKSITTFSTSTQAEELFVHSLKEKFKDNGLMQLEGRTKQDWSS